jgi:hypothetical protein
VPADLKVGDVVDLYSVTAAGAKLVEKNLRVRSIGPLGGAGTAAAPGAAAGTGGAAAPVAGGGIPLTVVGFDVSEAQGAELYTEILGKRGEPALLLHDAAAPS